MPKSTDYSPPTEGRHSFLYWLVIPLILVWFAGSYLIGAVRERPQWLSTGNTPAGGANTPATLATYSSLPQTGTGYITLWFDDAWLSQYLIAFPLLQENSFPGVIAVPSSAIEQPDYMNWAQLQNLQKSGWEITNHSVSHDCNMHTWNAEQIRAEYRLSRFVLWKHQLSSDILVTPCGVDSQVMRDEAAKSFFMYRTVNPGINDLDTLDLFNPRVRNLDDQTTLSDIKGWIDQAKEPNRWLILVFHQLGEKSNSAQWEKYELDSVELSEILEYIKQSQVPVVVPSQIISSIVFP